MMAARFSTMRATASVTAGSGTGGMGVSAVLAARIRVGPDASARISGGCEGGIVSAAGGEAGNLAGQQPARNGLRMLGLQTAAGKAGAAFDSDLTARLAHPVQGAGAIVGFQRGKRPVGFGKHVDAAFGADEDSEIGGVGGGAGSTLRGVQDGFGVLEKRAHTDLIGPARGFFRKMSTWANYCNSWTCTDEGALRERYTCCVA